MPFFCLKGVYKGTETYQKGNKGTTGHPSRKSSRGSGFRADGLGFTEIPDASMEISGFRMLGFGIWGLGVFGV